MREEQVFVTPFQSLQPPGGITMAPARVVMGLLRVHRQPPAVSNRVERAAGHKLHRQVDATIQRASVMHLHQVWMAHAGQRLALADEPVTQLWITG